MPVNGVKRTRQPIVGRESVTCHRSGEKVGRVKLGEGGSAKAREVEHDLGDAEAAGPMLNVGYKFGRTFSSQSGVKLKDFESVKVEVSLHVPCQLGEEDEAFDAAKDWVHERAQSVVEELFDS